MQVCEMSFRDMNEQMVEIHGAKMVQLLEKMGLKLDNLYGALMYGYIDHDAGFTFEIMALETKKYISVEYRIVPINVSCKIPRLDVQEMEIDIVDGVNISLFQDKIDIIHKQAYVSKTLLELRNYKDLDLSRHSEYPDDVIVYLLSSNLDPEACWLRLEGMKEDKMYGNLLVEPKQDFGVHKGDEILFGMTKMEDDLLACVWTK